MADEAPVESPPLAQDMVVAAGDSESWAAWLRLLLTRARSRLAQASLVLVGALLGGVFGLWLFAKVADDVMEQETHGLDNAVYLSLRQFASPGLDRLATALSWMGSELVAVLLAVLLLVMAYQRRWGVAVSLAMVAAGAQFLNNVLKAFFQRQRPNPTTFFIPAQAFSFPSGHAMVSASFYCFVAYLGWRLIPNRVARVVLVVVLGVVVFLIGLSRVYLGVHYFTDVIAGYAAGLVWTEAVILAGMFLSVRGRSLARPVAIAPP
jgi:undecaprenyl-diphosphatase